MYEVESNDRNPKPHPSGKVMTSGNDRFFDSVPIRVSSSVVQSFRQIPLLRALNYLLTGSAYPHIFWALKGQRAPG